MDLIERSALLGRRHPWEVARARFFLRLVERLGVLGSTGAWLDVGAGDAWFARQLRAVLPGTDRVACWDVHYGDEGPPADDGGGDGAGDRAGDGTDSGASALEFSAVRPAGVFGGVLLLDVVEHVEDDVAFVRSVVEESLAPGGWVLVSVPAYQVLFSDHDRFLRHVRRYSPGAIRAVVEGAGLRVEAHGGLFHSLLPVRVTQVLVERSRRRSTDGNAPAPAGIGAWRRGRVLTRALVRALGCDTALSLATASGRLPALPGLSTWVFCRYDDARAR